MRDLVVRAREGDRDAFAAQDAVQEAFIEAWRSLPGLREPDRFDAWMRRLLVRACFRGVHRNKRIKAVEIPLAPGDEPAISGVESDLDLHDQLERGLARLPAELLAVVVLVYYLDLPLADAAQAMGVPLGTTKSRLSYSRRCSRSSGTCSSCRCGP